MARANFLSCNSNPWLRRPKLLISRSDFHCTVPGWHDLPVPGWLPLSLLPSLIHAPGIAAREAEILLQMICVLVMSDVSRSHRTVSRHSAFGRSRPGHSFSTLITAPKKPLSCSSHLHSSFIRAFSPSGTGKGGEGPYNY